MIRDSKNPRPFSYLDFPKIPHGTFRNSISRLMRIGLVYVVIEGHPKFYACEGSGLKPKSKSMTLTPTGGKGVCGGLEEMLWSLGDAVTGVHDIRLLFDCPGLYSRLKLLPGEGNGDKRLSRIKFEKGRSAGITVHSPSSVSVFVGCSRSPFPRYNLSELCLILESVHEYIQFRCLSEPIQAPLIGDWLVVMWHYNKDGEEISGNSLSLKFRDFSGVICQLYAKSVGKGRVRPRLERIESPKKTVRELAAEVFDDAEEESKP